MALARYLPGGVLFLLLSGFAPTLAEPLGDETFEGSLVCGAPAGDGEAMTVPCRATINPGASEISLTLVMRNADAGGGRTFDRIELRRDGDKEPFQVLKGIGLRVPDGAEKGGLELVDVNFDGYFDLRARRAGPDDETLYQNWVWSTEKNEFVDVPELDAIVSPQFNAEDQEIVSHWKRAADERGSDIYSYDGQMPLLIHREIDRLSVDGACTRIFYDRIDDELKQTGSGACDKE